MKRSIHFLLFILFISSINSEAQNVSDTIITKEYFGFDFWGINKTFWQDVYKQMEEDSIPFNLVGNDAVNWQRIEPEPPENGIHNYHWELLDTLVRSTFLAGKVFDLGIRPASNWGTIYPADSMEVCCGMSPILPDSLSHPEIWGMTAKQAWKEFVFNLVERYDGDQLGQADEDINTNMIKTLMIGNEPEAPGHFFAGYHYNPGGTVAALNEIFELVYDTAKFANPDIIIVRGKSNPGMIFDDKPDNIIAYSRRPSLFDSLQAEFEYGAHYYDMFAINYNDHYTSLSGYVNWLNNAMAAHGFSKPFLVGDARTNLFPRDNFFEEGSQTQEKIMPSIYSPADTFLIYPESENYESIKTQWQKDKVMQSIKKLVMASANNQYQISLQPVYVVADFDQAIPRRYMWMYGGFFDPYIYENTYSLAQAREPIYWAVKQLANDIMGANKQSQMLNLGANIYAFKYFKSSGNDPIVIWHENHFLIDSETNLLQRNQNILVDLSSVFASPYVRVKHFVNQVDDLGEAISIADDTVATTSVPINEFPILLYPSTTSSVSNYQKNENIFIVYPNPIGKTLYIQTPYRGAIDLELINTSGETLFKQEEFSNEGLAIEIPHLSEGIYILKIICETDRTVSMIKLIK